MARSTYGKKNAQTQFPAPRYMSVRDNDDKKQAVLFFRFWHELPESMRDLAEVSFYRLWPVCDLRRIPENANLRSHAWKRIDGTIPFDPEIYREWTLEQFGSGEWHCILKERGVSGKCMECWFSSKSIPLDIAPPKVDLRTILPGVFENAGYVRWLHDMNQQLPWDETEEHLAARQEKEREQESEDMNAEVVRSVTEMAKENMKLVGEKSEMKIDRALEQLEEEKKKLNEEKQQNSNGRREGETESIRLVTGTAEKMIEMVTQNAGKQFDPVQMLETTAKILKRDDGESTKLMLDTFAKLGERQQQMQTETFAFLQKIVDKETKAPAAAAPEKPPSLREQLEEITAVNDMLGLGRKAREHAEPAAPAAPEKSFGTAFMEQLPLITGVIQTGFVLGANMLHNWAVGRSGKGTAEDPQAAIARAQAAAQPAGAAPGAAPQAGPAQDPRQFWINLVNSQIFKSGCIAHYFNAGCDGHTFAEYICGNGLNAGSTHEGRKIYTGLKELGRDNFEMLIRGNVDLWSQFAGTPQKFAQYLTEFFEYDEWLAGEDDPEGVENKEPAAA
jgi:hypothetical protein